MGDDPGQRGQRRPELVAGPGPRADPERWASPGSRSGRRPARRSAGWPSWRSWPGAGRGSGSTWPGCWPAWREAWRILRISLPAAGESLTNVVCQLWFLGLINRLGPTATAAHGVAIRCEALAFLTVTAFSIAAEHPDRPVPRRRPARPGGAGRPGRPGGSASALLVVRRGADLRRGRGDVRPLPGREAARTWWPRGCPCSGSWRSPCRSWRP